MLRSILPIALCACLMTSVVRAADEEKLRTVSTTGEAVIYVQPDEANITFGIETFDAQLDVAKATNDEAAARFLKAIKSLGVEDKSIQTSHIEVSIRYRDSNHPVSGIEGYYARRAYAITLKDLKLLEKLVDTGLKNGANQLTDLEYRSTELRKHRDEARKMAIKAAREKAVALANELGCGIGAPRSISEANIGYWQYGANFRGYAAQNAMQVNPGVAEGGEAMPLGQIGINATVSVTFDLVVGK